MSIRNMDADLAANKLNELFHLHRYEDCVLFVNRLSPLALRHLLGQLPIDAYLSRLPYTIELFEALYAKVFINDPDQFPARILQPERLIDKMVAYFSLLHAPNDDVEPVDGAKMLDSFENVIRVVSYVQPQQYSRLLYFKYAIDRALLRFERDLVAFGRNLATLNEYLVANQVVTIGHGGVGGSNKSGMKKSRSSLLNNYANALLISRASNLQTCETMRIELEKSIANCQKAALKLNEYISHLKAQKLSKNIQSLVFNHPNGSTSTSGVDQLTATTSPTHQTTKSSTLKKNTKASLTATSTTTTTPTKEGSKKELKETRKASVSAERAAPASASSVPKSMSSRSESVSNFTKQQQQQRSRSGSSSAAIPISSSTICQDFIQNRLYLNKAMMNSIEPFLESIKLQQLLNSLYEKIDLDKEILLVYTHIKREETYLNSLEPLQPLFKRYSLGFERCIQIWRKKCSADSLLIFNQADPIHIPDQLIVRPQTPANVVANNGFLNKSKSMENDESVYSYSNYQLSSICPTTPGKTQLEQKKQQHQLTAAALTAASSSLAAAVASSAATVPNGTSPTVVNSNISINYSTNLVSGEDGEEPSEVKHQKYFSEINLYSSPIPSNYGSNTMPAKFRSPKKQLNLDSDETQLLKRSSKTLVALSKNVETQTHPVVVVEESNSNNEETTTCRDDTKHLVSVSASDLEKLNEELAKARETIAKLKEEYEMSKQQQQQQQQTPKQVPQDVEKSKVIVERVEKSEIVEEKKVVESSLSFVQKSMSTEQEFHNFQYTYDLIHLYNNLNHKYRSDAFDALDLPNNDTQNVYEFKLKLLFSVIVLSYRYVKVYIRDLKRKVKVVLQIQDRSASTERTASQKSQTPTIVIQKAEDPNHQLPQQTHSHSDNTDSSHARSTSPHQQQQKRPSLAYVGRFNNVNLRLSAIENEQQASIKSIESALNNYLQASALTNSFDLNKIVEDVKQQLWTTLVEYPSLKECQELSSYINESVKTSWALVNHQPTFKLDYSTSKYNSNLHERTDTSNVQNEQILNYIWPALIDTSDNSCLTKGIVTT